MPSISADARANGHYPKKTIPDRNLFPLFAHEGSQKTYFPEMARGIIFEGRRGVSDKIMTVRVVASRVEYPPDTLSSLTPRIRAAILALSLEQVFAPSLLERLTGISAQNFADHVRTFQHAPDPAKQAVLTITRHVRALLLQGAELHQPPYKLVKGHILAASSQETKHEGIQRRSRRTTSQSKALTRQS